MQENGSELRIRKENLNIYRILNCLVSGAKEAEGRYKEERAVQPAKEPKEILPGEGRQGQKALD